MRREVQSCPILTTCSSRESEDSTGATRTSGVIGEIANSHPCGLN